MWTFRTDDLYMERPGLSPPLAALRAAGTVRAEDRVLEVGCGTGMDAVGLARTGVLRVVGLDRRAKALEAGRRRAEAAGVAARVSFVRGSAYKLDALVPRGAFDVAVDTLLGNNLRDQPRYADALAHAVRPGGLLVATYKVDADAEDLAEFGGDGPFPRHFEVLGQARTHLPSRTFAGRRTFLDVVTAVARRRPSRGRA